MNNKLYNLSILPIDAHNPGYVTNYLTCTIAKREALKQSIKYLKMCSDRNIKTQRKHNVLDCFAIVRNQICRHSEAECRRI